MNTDAKRVKSEDRGHYSISLFDLSSSVFICGSLFFRLRLSADPSVAQGEAQ